MHRVAPQSLSPTRQSSIAAGLAIAFVCAAACDSGPTSPTPPVRTFLSFVSDPGDYIGAGQTRRFDDDNSTITAQALASRRAVFVNVVVQNKIWSLYLGAPEGEQLRPGTYERAVRWYPPIGTLGVPSLTLSGESRACNTATGRFVVHTVVFGASDSVQRLHATFEQHCEGAVPKVSGEVSVVS